MTSWIFRPLLGFGAYQLLFCTVSKLECGLAWIVGINEPFALKE